MTNRVDWLTIAFKRNYVRRPENLIRELERYIDSRSDQALRLLETLVNIDSGTYCKAGVDAVGAILASEMQSLGFGVHTVPQSAYGDHLLCHKPGDGRRLLFLGHMDTVFAENAALVRPFNVQGERAYGPGVLDMKGGIVCLLSALEALRAVAPSAFDSADLVVLFNSDEEVLSPTSRTLIEAQAEVATAVCVLEPARQGGEYVTQRKCAGKFWLRVHGRAAHVGVQPELGASAVHALAHKIVDLVALADYEEGVVVNVGVLRGGSRSNVVADEAEAEIDVRAWTMDQGKQVIDAMRAIADLVHITGTRATLLGEISVPPMERTKGTADLFSCVRQVGHRLGLDLRETATGGVSDGNYAACFAPVLDGMGPVGGGAHGPDEYIEIASLGERTKVLALFLADWAAPLMKRETLGDVSLSGT
ncbi:MAG: M20 family metallopeptidase [Chloroflexota bacterium]